jgi:hypothetical protein
MHQLKEVDMLSAKIDLPMKKLDERDNEKKEVMHIHDSRITCEECGGTGHSGSNCPEISRGCELHQQQQYQLSSSTKSRMESITKAQLPR